VLLGCPDRDSLSEIRAQHRAGQFAPTLEPLRALVDRDPTDPEANYLLGRALLRTGEGGLAVWPLRRAVESPEYAVEAGLLLTRVSLLGRFAHEAIKAADAVLSIEPDNVAAFELRVQAYLKASRFEDALADVARVFELDPENLAVLVPQVLALLSLERVEEAEEALATTRLKLESAGERVGPAMRAKLCAASGQFAFENGEPERAKLQFAECLDQFPTDELAVQSAVQFHDGLGERERGTEILRKAFEDSGSSHFRNALAARMQTFGKREEALELLRAEAEERPSAASWFAVADYYVDAEDYEAAAEAFDRALAAGPDPPPMIRFAYADTLIQKGDYAKARELARDIEQDSLRNLIEGRAHLAEGDARSALAAFEAGIKLWPNNAGARFLAGQAAERLGDFERASSEYRESVRANAAETEAGLFLARLYEAQGSYGGALDAIGHYARKHPADPESYLVSIRLAHRVGNRGVVNEGLQRLSALPGMAGVAAAESASLMAAVRGPAAARQTIESSALDLTLPENAPALRALLAQLAALGEHEAARERVARALAAEPEAAVFHELRGRALLAADEPRPLVRQAFERAIELEPANARALAGLAELSAEAGELEPAIALYERAAAADASDPEPLERAIELLVASQQTLRAEALLERVIEQFPRSAEAANQLARLLAARGGDLDRALAHASRATSLRQTAEFLETLGWVKLLLGAHQEAAEALTAALEQHPDAVGARYRLGLARLALGDEEAARSAFQGVVDAHASPEAEQARAELARLDGGK
jgi:tetratricopeptide (TPR) repeat protein